MMVVEESSPDDIREMNGAPRPKRVFVEEVGGGVSGDAAHAGRNRGKAAGGAADFGGGVGEGVVEPVGRCGGLLGWGEVGGRGGFEELAGDRVVGADAAGVECGGDDGFAVAVCGLFPVLDEGWASGEDLGEAGVGG